MDGSVACVRKCVPCYMMALTFRLLLVLFHDLNSAKKDGRRAPTYMIFFCLIFMPICDLIIRSLSKFEQ